MMSLYGYFLTESSSRKENISGHDAIHFTFEKRVNRTYSYNYSVLWFSAGEEFYYIEWNGTNITPEIEEIVKSASDSIFTHDEFYSKLKEENDNYKLLEAIEHQGPAYSDDSGSHDYYSYGRTGYRYGFFGF